MASRIETASESGEGLVGAAINRLWLAEEEAVLRELLPLARLEPRDRDAVRSHATALVEAVRGTRTEKSGMDAFLREYDLSSQEGVILMCLAEALLRIPDAVTADKLIADKIKAGDWASHLTDGGSLFVNASTWGLVMTGRLVQPDAATLRDPGGFVRNLVARAGEPVVRTALRQAMRILGHQFVMGRTIAEALERSGEGMNARYRYSYDMLGESALTMPDADRYLEAYAVAIDGMSSGESDSILNFLAPYLIQAAFTCRLRWEPDMLAAWDNRLCVHQAFNDYPGYRRELYRTTVRGERPS